MPLDTGPDPSSLSNFQDAAVTHSHIELDVDFETRVLSGFVEVGAASPPPAARPLSVPRWRGAPRPLKPGAVPLCALLQHTAVVRTDGVAELALDTSQLTIEEITVNGSGEERSLLLLLCACLVVQRC